MATADPKAFMPLYVGDYMRDTGHLVAEEHGAYLMLLMQMWVRGGQLPADETRLRLMANVAEDRWPDVWAAIAGFFRESGSHIIQPRLAAELEKARKQKQRRIDQARRAAEARWSDHTPDAGSNAGSNADAVPEECPSPSPSPSGRDSLAALVAPARARAGQDDRETGDDDEAPDAESGTGTGADPAHVRSVLGYLNDLAGTAYQPGHDSEYLAERLAEGWTVEKCEQAIEAALASEELDDVHPRRVFSRRWFSSLVQLRTKPAWWAKHRERFEAAVGETQGAEP